MAYCSEHKNPLHNNGTSQAQRLLPGMDKNQFAMVDEKNFADWIIFANDFAAFINYYNPANAVAGNWQSFFSSDISARLGIIAIQNINRYKQEIKERFDFIRDDDNDIAPLVPVKIKLNELFSALLTLAKALDEQALKLTEESPLQQTIKNLIATKLAPSLNRLIAYYKAADGTYTQEGPASTWTILNKPLSNASQILASTGLSKNWYDETVFADWVTYIGSITADTSIFENSLTGITDEYLSIEHAANHNLFTGIFDTWLSAYAKIIKEAEAELLTTLTSYDSHTPHYALFLSFLKLFRFSQTHINSITQRHIDFYYKEVLRLQPRPAEANQVHVLGELAKQVDKYLLAEGSALKAGKDSLKKEVNYTLDADAVFSKAKVTQLKTFYKAETADTIINSDSADFPQNNTNRIFASPISNSDDGVDAALTSDNKEWHPFVHKVFKNAQLESIAMPKAEIGFALASHYLYLTEGQRVITIKFDAGTEGNAKLLSKPFECYITTEKGWLKFDVVAQSIEGAMTEDLTSCAQFEITLLGDQPATSNYNAEVHGGTFDVDVPMLKMLLVQNNAEPYEYEDLKDIVIYKTEIEVAVGDNSTTHNQNGIKNLFLSNDYGDLDASKPFLPFGPQPKRDSGFVIGHKEIFSKKSATVKLNIEWAEISAFSNTNIDFGSDTGSAFYPLVTSSLLESGQWMPKNESEGIFLNNNSKVQIFKDDDFAVEANGNIKYSDPYERIGAGTISGFLKLTLNDDFGHQSYLRTLTRYLIDQGKTNPTGLPTEPTEPYTPKIKSLYADYTAHCMVEISASETYDKREIKFFHIYPFGQAEQHKYLNPSEDVYLLPQFKHAVGGTTIPHQGELYIGIENLKPNEAVDLLFQTMEGTTNPTIVKPTDHILWSYLSNNIWEDFQQSDYSDNTLNLVQSGIISFAIPNNATTANTMLPTNHIWLRASVGSAAEAVCKLISVDAQASVATFNNNDYAPDFLDTALPAGSIAKLKVPVAAVKKIKQPYPSFGGRAKENEDHFYIRVSERLRHKNRAVTVWDYEHLVLEAFPEIYKVKCLNHTQIEDGVYHEVRPGYVSIITIPSQQNRNDADPLKPYTQQSTLTKIENFLNKRSSCFVKLKACQPQFEEVRLEFHLKLYDTYTDFTFYTDKLKEEITQFLSPWAYGSNSKIDFGGKVHKSVLINFIEERYYVDFITDVFMYVKVEGALESGDMDEIIASTARSILVSANASKHTIHKIEKTDIEAEEVCVDPNNISET